MASMLLAAKAKLEEQRVLRSRLHGLTTKLRIFQQGGSIVKQCNKIAPSILWFCIEHKVNTMGEWIPERRTGKYLKGERSNTLFTTLRCSSILHTCFGEAYGHRPVRVVRQQANIYISFELPLQPQSCSGACIYTRVVQIPLSP